MKLSVILLFENYHYNSGINNDYPNVACSNALSKIRGGNYG
jgi:hypothetical protein